MNILDGWLTMKSEKNNMSGFFTNCIIENGLVKKKINFHSADEYDLYVDVLKCDDAKVLDYYDKLSLAKVVMPKLMDCKNEDGFCTIYQEYIEGISLNKWISNNGIENNLDKHLNFFNCLLESQLQAFYLDNSIRIDFNLNNFIVKNEKLYLVDIMPPIFIDQTVKEKSKGCNKKISRLIELYTNINYQIVSVIGYWFLDCLNSLSKIPEPHRREIVNDILLSFLEHGNRFIDSYHKGFIPISKSFVYENADNYFFKRLFLLHEYIDQKIQFDELVYLFNLRLHSK